MDASYSDENARLRALLPEQQTTIRKMAEYNRLLSLRVAAYASEINRLKALVAKLQRMQFGKSSEKLREKTQRQLRGAEERISALQEAMAEVLGEQHDLVLPQTAASFASPRNPHAVAGRNRLPGMRWRAQCSGLRRIGAAGAYQQRLKVIETQRPKLACCSCDHIVQTAMSSKPIERSYAGPGLLARIVTAKFAEHVPQDIPSSGC